MISNGCDRRKVLKMSDILDFISGIVSASSNACLESSGSSISTDAFFHPLSTGGDEDE